MIKLNKIYCENCLDTMARMDDNYVDAIVTDPPYGISFMNKKWDYDVPSVKIWQEVLRVLKPGGHLLSFGGTRTYHRMACAIEDAGFEIRDMVQWIYGSGFPKSLDISKAIDKTGKRYEFFNEVRTFLKEALFKTNYTIKDINILMGYALNGSGMAGHWFGNITQQTLPTKNQWFKLKELLDFTDCFDETFRNCINPNERPIIGKHPNPAGSKGNTFPLGQECNLTKPATPEAEQWEGWGTALKPANEPICLARKPLSEKTIAENVLKWGTGGLNIDECRVEYQNDNDKNSAIPQGRITTKVGAFAGRSQEGIDKELNREEWKEKQQGRFPANVIHNGSDEVVSRFPNSKSGLMKQGTKVNSQSWFTGNDDIKNDTYGDSGSAARFFYCAKASRSERGKGNNHPTVKPVSLLRYLCRLITPPKRLVYDPFIGSGTTGIAAGLEGFDYIGSEIEQDYCEIAKKRISAYTMQQELF